nr:MAG TPA: hyaluronidase [Caudoviricetes sp.]
MATTTLSTRITLKYDTLANWNASEFLLKKGEVAICSLATGETAEQSTPPAVLLKVGDGAHKFSELPWASGLAADVYGWAKAAVKPTYTYTEVGADEAGSAATALQSAKDYADEKFNSIPAAAEYTLATGDTDGSVVLKKNNVAVGDPAVIKGFADLLKAAVFTEYQTTNDKAVKAAADAAAAAQTAAQQAQNTADGKYSKPEGGIGVDDLSAGVKASLTKADSAIQDISGKQDKLTPGANISIVDNTIGVTGLGTAAFKATEDFATAAQGELAASAVQSVATGSKDGNISVDGTDVAVKGLKALAFKESLAKGDVGLGNVENKTMDAAPTASSENYVTSGGVKTYVDNAIAAVKQFQYEVVSALPAASADTMGKIYLVSDVHSSTDNYDEFITLEKDGAYSWEKIGNTDIDLSGYVKNTTTIAGVDLQDNITKAELLTALNVADGATKVDESTVSGWGFTKNHGTVNSVKMNGKAVAITDGAVDLGTVITAHQSLDGKQDKLSDVQLEAVNSGITSDKVLTYDGYAALINGKQGALDETQLAAVNSGITTTKVAKYDGYESSINGKQDKITSASKLSSDLVDGLGAAASKGVDATIAANSASTNLPTSKAVEDRINAHAGIDKVGTVTSVSAGVGLKITGTAGVTPKVEIDEATVFVFDCGSATVNID